MVMLCQRKIVCVSGITPVIGSSDAGIDDFVACSSAADDESPSAQTLPSPRYATAPRAVFGIDASHRVSRAIGGDDATTNPPTITMAICMVKFTSDQNPFPNSVASVTGFTPANVPPMNTSTMAASAKTNASGNH